MVAYTSNELIPSSDFAKKFGSYLAQVQNSAVEKIAILKNNNIEAILLSKDKYEQMQSALEQQEHQELYGSIKFKENQQLFQKTFSDIVNGEEILTPYTEGMDELDSMIDEIENENFKK